MGILLQEKEHRYVKYGMYTLNFFISTLGLALTGVGIWIRIDFDVIEYRTSLLPIFDLCGDAPGVETFEISVHIDTIAYFLIFLGVAIIGIGGVGTCGAVSEKQALIGMFCILLFIIFAILLTAGIHSVNYKDAFVACEELVTSRLRQAVGAYYSNTTSRRFMDSVQTEMTCCGADKGSSDYGENVIPKTCKVDAACDKVIKDFFGAIADNMTMIVVISFSIGIFTIAGMGMSAFLFTSIRKAKSKLWTQERKDGTMEALTT